MHTRPIMEINLTTICENYTFIKNHIHPITAACVLKNNAYGLGIEQIGRALYDHGCHTFFVAYGCEGQQLKQVAPNSCIYVLQGFGEEERSFFQQADLIPVLPTQLAIDNWFKNPANMQHPAIQVETGLHRLGLDLNEAKQIAHLPVSLILSHLACADECQHYLNEKQKNTLLQFKSVFPDTPFSLSASDGVFLGRDFHFDMVRLGAALYGINTTPYEEKKVKNCVKITAPILQIKTVQAGETVGYSATYTVKRPTKIATVSIGYADGIFRNFQENGALRIQAENTIFKAPVIGRVSMDNIMCDVSNIPENILNNTQYMTLIDDFYDLDAFGTDCKTIGYEALNNLGHGTRYDRRYIK